MKYVAHYRRVDQFGVVHSQVVAVHAMDLYASLSCGILNNLAAANWSKHDDDQGLPDTMVKHSCDLAARLVEEWEKRGWIEKLPSPEIAST